MKNQKRSKVSVIVMFMIGTLSLLMMTNQCYADAASCSAETMSHYWNLDETGSPYVDLCETNNAVCTNCPAAVTGIINGAQTFNGIDDAVDVADDNTFEWGSTDSFSIELWINTDSGNTCDGTHVFAGRDDQTTGLQWWVGCKNIIRVAVFNLTDKSGTDYSTYGSTVLNDGAWHHIVSVRDAGANENRIYVDGVQEGLVSATYSAGFDSTTSEMNIGYLDTDIPDFHFNGSVDEVAIYNRVLSAEEISRHYSNGLIGIGYLTMDINITDSISPADDLQMDFGSIVESFSSAEEIVTISNTGNSDLSVSNIQLTGTNPGEFTLDVNGGTTPCAGTAFNISAGDNCTIAITFSPTTTGSMSANLEITSDDPDESSVIVALSGTGTVPDINVTDSISPTDDLQMDFGTIVESFSSGPEIVTISNTGSSDLSVSNIQLTGTNPGEFTLDVNGGTTPCAGTAFNISAGDNCTIAITFSPTTTGSMSANLEITSDDPDESSVIVALSGTGVLASDLVVKSVSNPPDAKKRGKSFYITAKVKNQGVGSAYKEFTVRHYLSKNKSKLINEEVDILLTGDVLVSSLDAGAKTIIETNVTIEIDTPSGRYYVKVCADSGNDLMESNENNNCRTSLEKIWVKK